MKETTAAPNAESGSADGPPDAEVHPSGRARRRPCPSTAECSVRRRTDEIEQLEVLKDDLVAMLVHDLRNPLTGLMGILEFVASEIRDPEILRDLDLAREGVARINLTVEAVLATRQLEERQFPLVTGRVDVHELLNRVTGTLARTAQQRGATIELVPTDLVLGADLELLVRALENLLSNAIRYSPRGGRVRIGARGAEGGVELYVADAGPGVPDAAKEHLFEKLASSDARSSARRGFGYGLYLVKLVASAHGGRAFARDVAPSGAEFVLFLPA